MKTYTLITYTNGGVDFSEDRPMFTDKKIAMVALSLSNDRSALLVNNCNVGEISGYQKNNGKIRVFSIEGMPKLNLFLFSEGSIITPIEDDWLSTKRSASKIYSKLQDILNKIDNL